jgi:hypothetical protein
MSKIKLLSFLRSLIIVILIATADVHAQDLSNAWKQMVFNIENTQEQSVKQSELKWFLGFVEGATGVRPPAFFREGINGINLDYLPSCRTSGKLKSPYYSLGTLAVPKHVIIENQGFRVRALISKEELLLPGREWIEKISHSDCLVLTLAEQQAFVAFHSDRSSPFEVLCVQRADGNVLWRSKVNPLPYHMGHSGFGFHYAEIAKKEGQIFVFGTCDDCSYVACLDAATGKNKWTFSTEDRP